LTNPWSGDVMHIATENPPNEEEGWINRMIEATARQISSQADVDAWFNKTGKDMKAWLAREAIPRCFAQIPYSRSTHQATVHYSEWDDSTQLRNGYVMGAQLSSEEATRTPFSDFNGMISVYANYTAAARAYALRSKI
jgi:hypothetical protein